MTSREPIDWAHTQKAEHDRRGKAAALAAAARRLAVPPAGLDLGAGHRKAVLVAAGVRSASEDTWFLAVQLLAEQPPAAGPRPRGCMYHPDRPAGFYLCGWRCEECAPGKPPTPPAGTTLDDLRARRPPALVVELDTRIQAAKTHDHSAAGRARIAEQAHRLHGRTEPSARGP